MLALRLHYAILFRIYVIMKKLLKNVCDVAVTVGCCLGVGLLSGKEAQIFVGNYANIAIFAVVFALTNIAFRQFASKKRCDNLEKLSKSCFARGASVFDVCLLACCFVCVTTMLAGVEQCVSQVFPLSSPLYAVMTATIAAVIMIRGLSALKIVNIISLLMAFVLIAIILTKRSEPQSLQVGAHMPVIYALFSTTMSLGVICKLACDNTSRENVACSVIAAILLGAIMLLVLPSCNFALDLPTLGKLNGAERVFAAVTLVIAAVTGLVANAYPILESISDVIPDRTLASAAIFTLALALSAFGFDFAVKFGYVFVGVIGLTALVCAVYKSIKHTLDNRKRQSQ